MNASRQVSARALFHEPACALASVPELDIAEVLAPAEDLAQHRAPCRLRCAVRAGKSRSHPSEGLQIALCGPPPQAVVSLNS